MADQLADGTSVDDELADTQPYFNPRTPAQGPASQKHYPLKENELFDNLMLSSSSLDPVDATLSPSKHTKKLPRRDQHLLEELKGPAAQRPRLDPFAPFSFHFGKETGSASVDQQLTKPSEPASISTPAIHDAPAEEPRKSSASSELEAPPASLDSPAPASLKTIRKNYTASPDSRGSPKKKPAQAQSTREKSPELPPTPSRRIPLSGAPAGRVSPSHVRPTLTSSNPASVSDLPPSQNLEFRRPHGSVPSSALSQESAQPDAPPPKKHDRGRGLISPTSSQDLSQESRNKASRSQQSQSQESRTPDPLTPPVAPRDEPSAEQLESESSQPKKIAESSADQTPTKRRRISPKRRSNVKEKSVSPPRDPFSQENQEASSDDRRVTRSSQRSQASRMSNEKEENCLPGDEEEEEMLSQHSQRSVPKTLSKASKKGGQKPLHSVATLFRGLRFLVTGLQPLNESEAKDYDENLRVKICESITTRSGVLEEDIERVHPRDRKSAYQDVPSVLLISDRARTTIKYLSALAAGVPCVHYLWLEHCITSKLIVPCREYLLPAGYSQSLQKVITHEDFAAPNAMDGLRVEILGGSNYVNIWSKIIRAAGGKCVRRLFTADEEHIDVICSPEDYLVTIHVRNKADQLKKPLVSLQWIKQCLIDRRLVPFRPYTIHSKK